MNNKSLRSFFIIAAFALVLSVLVPTSSIALATETMYSMSQVGSTADVIVPTEVAGSYTQVLPTYNSASIGTFDNAKDLALAVLESNKAFETSISFRYTGNIYNLNSEFQYYYYDFLDDPGNDYVAGTLNRWSLNYSTTGDCSFTFTYMATLEQENYVTEQVKQIAASLQKPGMTELDLVRAVNDYVVTHTVYSKSAKTTPHHIYAYLKEGKAVCQAYALLTYRLLTEMGIEARYVVGYGNKEAHAWNSVKIDGEWYHLDTTWNDASFNGYDTITNIGYRYFLVTSDTLRRDHSWDEEAYPVATSDKYSYFHKIYMGIEHNGEIYYSDSATGTLHKLNLQTTSSEQLLNQRAYYLAAHNEYIYFSNYSNGAYLYSYNLITGETNIIVNSNVRQLQIDGDNLTYKVGSTTKSYPLPLSATELEVRNVEMKIAALSEFSNESEISTVRAAYENLSTEQKLAVSNLDKLVRIETAYPINIAAANNVASIVSKYSTSSSRSDLLAVISQYDELTPAQQALVSNKASVMEFKAIITAQNSEIKNVEKTISSLKSSSKTYLSDIEKARTLYDSLKGELKAEVSNYTNLQKIETDVASAKNTYDLIEALDGSSIADIAAARASYDSLSKTMKTFVTNTKKLTTYEASLTNVLAAIKAINAIDPNNTKFVSQVTSARTAFNKAGNQQNLVTNADKFLSLEKQSKVYSQIAKLNPSSSKYIAEVTAAKTAFDGLAKETDAITNVEKLNTAVKAIQPAQKVVALIAAIDGTSAEAIQDARTAYNKLDKTSQKYITNIKQLTSKEAELKYVPAAITAISAIDPSSTKFVSQVNAARTAYNKTGSLNGLVTNGTTFLAIEKQAKVYDQIAKLKNSSAKYVAEVTAAKTAYDALGKETDLVTNSSKLLSAVEAIKPAQKVITIIDNLDGTSITAVEEARTAYNSLDATSKKYIANLKKLTTKEAEIKNIPAAILAIDAIDPTSTKFTSLVTSARTAYNKVGSMQSFVTNGPEFLIIDNQFKVNDQITKLKVTSTKYIAEVTAAKDAFDKLKETTYVNTSNIEKLNTAVNAIKPAQAVVDQISKLDTTSISSVLEARAAYNALTAQAKKYITNYKDLTAAEKKSAAPIKVINLITTTKNTDVTTSKFLTNATAMKKAYVALSAEHKAMVTNHEDYTYYVALYEIKNAQKTRKWTNVSVETFADLEITGVTADNLSLITAKFNSLKAGSGTATVQEIQSNVTKFLGN